MLLDLKFALRTLRRSPAFAAIVIVTLALGIGANAAIFSVVDAIALHPLPLPQPARIVSLTSYRFGDTAGSLSWPDFADIRDQTGSFQNLVAYRNDQYTLTDTDAQPQLVQGATATAELFTVLGVQPALGRGFAAGEDEAGRNHVVVLSHQLWQARFLSDPKIIGRTITLDEEPYTIIGVAPAWLHFPPGLQEAGLFAPMPHGAMDTEMRASRGSYALRVLGRLRPGVSVEQARSEVETVQSRLSSAYPESDGGRVTSVIEYEKQLVGDQRPAMLLLLCAVGFVLLIACANVSNLLLARAGVRQREIAIRAALGASRARIMRQLLSESLLLAGIGGALGLLLSLWGRDALITLIPNEVPRMTEIAIDGRVLVFTVVVSIVTGLLFGLVPAIHAARLDVDGALKGSGSTPSASRGRARSALLVAEIAMAMLLVVGAGLTLRSFSRLSHVDPGFNPHDILTASLSLPAARYSDQALVVEAYRELQERMRAIPGVEASALAVVLPLTDTNTMGKFGIDGLPPPMGERWPDANTRFVSPDYFKAMRTRVVRGRTFVAADDDPNAAPTIVINETAARRYWPNKDPIGTHVEVNLTALYQTPSYEVIGVVQDVKFASLGEPADVEMYTPFSHTTPAIRGRRMFALLRGPHAAGFAGPLSAAVQQVDGYIAVSDVKTMDTYLSQSLARQRWSTVLLTIFGALALMLAVFGVYAVVSHNVTQRSREIAIRVALGAQRTQILRMIFVGGLRLTLVGVAFGTAGALALTRLLGSQLQTDLVRATPVEMGRGLYGISATDPATFAVIAILLISVAMLASFLPARRAMSVDPMVAMRGD
jgi:putative ABC transport system permease protein